MYLPPEHPLVQNSCHITEKDPFKIKFSQLVFHAKRKLPKSYFLQKNNIQQDKLVMISLQAKCHQYVKKDNFQDIWN